MMSSIKSARCGGCAPMECTICEAILLLVCAAAGHK